MGPEPTTVWLVRPGRPEAVRGTLSIDPETLTFIPVEGDPLPIPIGRIGRARRRRGTPILELTYTDARAEESVLFIYFVKPPPLPSAGPGAGRRGAFSWIVPTRGLQQTASAMSLRAANRSLKSRIEAWASAIRGAR